jgi:hypothetical protein
MEKSKDQLVVQKIDGESKLNLEITKSNLHLETQKFLLDMIYKLMINQYLEDSLKKTNLKHGIQKN